MKYLFHLQARTSSLGTIEAKHDKLMQGLSLIEDPWGVKEYFPPPAINTDVVATFSLTKKLGKNLKGGVRYRYRNLLKDDSAHDDAIDIEFNPLKIDYKHLIDNALYAYIRSFNPYLAYITDQEFTYIDFAKSRGKNLRNDIIRFYPVCFFDDLFCERNLNLSVQEVFEKLQHEVEKVELVANGVLIVGVSKLFSIAEAEEIHQRLSKVLLPL